MERKVSIYFTPVDGCDNTWCQLYKSCSFSGGEIHHMDVNILNGILQNCFLHMSRIERLYFAVRGNSQVYIHARDIDLGGFSSRCIMSFTYPYPIDNFPINMGKMYKIDSANDIKYLMALPDLWEREITKLYTIVSSNNLRDVPDILYMMNELRRKRTFLYTINSIKRVPDRFIDEKTILPLLRNYQYKQMKDYHVSGCHENGIFITIDYLGRAQLCLQDESAFVWTDFKDVLRQVLELRNNSEICTSCLKNRSHSWRYAIL